VAFHVYLARKASDVDERAVREQTLKWKKEDLESVVPLNEILDCAKGLPFSVGMEVLLQYKAFPQPDFDYFGAMYRQQKLYRERKVVADSREKGIHFAGIMLYHKYMMVVTYFKMNHRCPGVVKSDADFKPWHGWYPAGSPVSIPFREVNDIDLNGDFDWIFRTTDTIDMVKDKAICPINIASIKDAKDSRKVPVLQKNYLMNWLSRHVQPNLEELNKQRESLFYDLKAEDKPEAKKPNGRWFFEAHTEARLMQSQYEESVARYCKNCPGSCNGISVAEKTARMNAVANMPVIGGHTAAMLLSFDIDKFSPTLDIEIHKQIDLQWAEAFGIPELDQAYRIFTDGTIHYVKGSIHHTAPKTGADFEGFAGRKLTFYHCAVMGYCVRILKERKLQQGPASFACLIDDGLLRLTLPIESYEQRKMAVLSVIEEIYIAACLFISWDKTYVSATFGIFLNEIFFKGRLIQPAMKALLKITAKSDAIVPSLLNEMEMVESTCRGAIAAGAPFCVTYALYAWHITDCIRKWGKRSDVYALSVKQITKIFMPVSLGGLGLTTPLLMGGSIGHTSITEGLGIVRMIALAVPILNKQVESTMNLQILPISERNQVINPLHIQNSLPTLKATRIKRLIERHIQKAISSSVLTQLLTHGNELDNSYLDLQVRGGAFLPVEVRDSMRRSDPAYAIEQICNKFMLSSTAGSFVPRRALLGVAYANIKEAFEVTKSYFVNR
jgi:hypothetical protein